ncbi:MAG: hypothetical protein ABI577_17760 [bacterium]
MFRTVLLGISMVALGASVRWAASPVEPGHASSEAVQGPSAATLSTPVAAAHGGDPLCIHHDVYPVARFVDDYTDGIGQHYHGWRPPAGPPFYVQCPISPDDSESRSRPVASQVITGAIAPAPPGPRGDSGSP